ncbi:DNA primase [Pseudomonas alliivorans]|uniref:DNA primase n=1 Tax=Pseudomonas alliivorans TaxID=2810613 RepID=UPI00403AC076
MIRIDFDVPSYLRLPQGLCIVSERLAHKLPEPESNEALHLALEPVVINTLYRPEGRNQVVSIENQEQGEIKGEFIPRESQPAHQETEETAQEIQVAQGDVDQVERALELNFQGVAGRSVTGEYRGSGFAHYRFLKKNGKSFFLRIGEHLVWGIELNAQLRKSGAQQGDKISLTYLGKTAVSVLKEVVVDGKKEQEWVDTYRNSWEIKIVK